MRKGEILGLKWPQIRNGFIYLEKTKTDESRQIPINEELEALFKEMRKTAVSGRSMCSHIERARTNSWGRNP